jgi:hypothetical protein
MLAKKTRKRLDVSAVPMPKALDKAHLRDSYRIEEKEANNYAKNFSVAILLKSTHA